MKRASAGLVLVAIAGAARAAAASPPPAAGASKMLDCLLSGWPAAEECHARLMAQGPKAVAAVRPGLARALKDDPGLAARIHNNHAALRATARSREPMHPDTARLKRAVAAASEFARLGEWKRLAALGTVTAAEGLGHLETPPRAALLTLTRWASDSSQKRRQVAAAYSLKWYGPKAAPVVPELIAMLDSDDSRLCAFETLEAIGPGAAAAVPRLARFLKEARPGEGWDNSARSALGAIKTPEAERLLEEYPAWTVAP